MLLYKKKNIKLIWEKKKRIRRKEIKLQNINNDLEDMKKEQN